MHVMVEITRGSDGRLQGCVASPGHLPIPFSTGLGLLAVLETLGDGPRLVSVIDSPVLGPIHRGLAALAGRIARLPGVDLRLRGGAKVAELCCGDGELTLVLAQAYPNSWFLGLDHHPAAIAAARQAMIETGLDTAWFEVDEVADLPGTGYDLIIMPVRVADAGSRNWARVVAALQPGGAVVLIEAAATGEDRGSPVGLARLIRAGQLDVNGSGAP